MMEVQAERAMVAVVKVVLVELVGASVESKDVEVAMAEDVETCTATSN